MAEWQSVPAAQKSCNLHDLIASCWPIPSYHEWHRFLVESGWDIKRHRISRDYNDGVKSPLYWDKAWIDDDAQNSDEILIPKNDKIYVIDSPSIGRYGDNSAETNNNFQEWVQWNDEECSGKADWHYKGTWSAGPPSAITDHVVDTGHMILPTY